jgi:glycosyltransferase involved in cell wall biosynthesis
MNVSVLLLTFNEASNLPRCLNALMWCDDIIVVDSGSTDGTVELARQHGGRVLSRPFDDFAAQRNFGLTEGRPKHDWILHLDADEVVTEAFVKELSSLDPPSGIDAYNVPSKLILHDRWLRYAGMYPVYQVRLGHRDRLRFKQVGHGQREDLPADRVGVFREPYLHYNFSHGLSAWLRKHVKYAEDEVRWFAKMSEAEALPSGTNGIVARRRALKALSRYIPLVMRPLARAFYMLIVRRAFLDGRAGLLYVGMLCTYEAIIALQVYERRLKDSAKDRLKGGSVSQ